MKKEKYHATFFKLVFHVQERNEKRKVKALKLLVKSICTQKEKSAYGRVQLENLQSQFETFKNLKQVDELKKIRAKAVELKKEHHATSSKQFMLINQAVSFDYNFELN